MTAASLWFLGLLVGGAVLAVAVRRLTPQRLVAVLLMAGAAALAVARQFPLAIPLAFFGYSLWMRSSPRQTPSPGQVSEVRSAGLAMSLDHETGVMDGTVLTGAFEGTRLSRMDAHDLQTLVDLFQSDGDEESLSLLLAYLDRRSDTGEAERGTADEAEPASASGGMSREEAWRILGLEPGADAGAIREAHRRLIKKMHPDLGGSSALAALINEAKQTLDPEN